jgi:hypothetical protein
MSKKPEKPKTRKAPVAQALARHKAAQAAIDARFGQIDDEALADQTPPRETLSRPWPKRLASDAEFLEKLRYLLAHEARICERQPDGHQEFGSILVAVDRHFNRAA